MRKNGKLAAVFGSFKYELGIAAACCVAERISEINDAVVKEIHALAEAHCGTGPKVILARDVEMAILVRKMHWRRKSLGAAVVAEERELEVAGML